MTRCESHPITSPRNDCADCQIRERLAMAIFSKAVWCNSTPEDPPKRWGVEAECPEWMRDDYRYLAGAVLEHLAPHTRETVICAAIRLPDGRVIRGHRHGDCIRTAKALVTWYHNPESGFGGPPWHESMGFDQGFISSRNRYVTREEGLALQHAAGIPSACPSGYRESQLFSQDLY